MKKLFSIGLAAACALTVVGCYKHSFQVGSGGNLNAEPAYSSWESHWLFGIIGESNADISKLCPSGNATIKDEMSFLNGLVGAFTGIVWHPTTVEVYCGGEEKAAAVQFTPAQLREIGTRPGTVQHVRHISEVKAAELQTAIETYREAHKNVAVTGTSTHL